MKIRILLPITVALFAISTLFGPVPAYAAGCISTGSQAEADPLDTKGAVSETVCNSGIPGPLGKLICKISDVVSGVFNFFNLNGNISFSNAAVPASLREARMLALSGKELTMGEKDSVTGAIAKMLIPGYKEVDALGKEISPITALTRAEGRLTRGNIIFNDRGRENVYGDINPNREHEYGLLEGNTDSPVIAGYFGGIIPVYDRFGFLQKALVPNAGDFSLPDTTTNCSLTNPLNNGAIQLLDSDRGVNWNARKKPNVDKKKKTSTAQGDLKVASEVGFVKELWDKMANASETPGDSGVFNVLLPPDTEFRTTDSKESATKTRYSPASPLSGVTEKTATIPIAYLGNVKGALDCIVDGLTAHPASANSLACQQALETPFGPVSCTDEATPLEFPNTAGSSIARRAWEIVNRLYQGFWCLWNWSKDDYPQLFDEDAYRRDPNPPYPLPPSHSGNLFWCTELVRRSQNNLSLSTNSAEMAKQFGAPGNTGGPSNGNWISISDATWQNIRPGYVVFFIVPGPTDYRLNHVGIVYNISRDGLTLVQSNAGTKSLLIPVGDNGRISGTVGNFRVMGFGRP